MNTVSPLIKPLKVGKVKLKNNLFLAPLAGYTDIAFRRLCRDFGAGLTTTEMVSVRGLGYNNAHTLEMLALASNETPSCIQLFGSDPEHFKNAIQKPELSRFDIIDINMGCPMPKITKNGDGSALSKDPLLAARIVEAAVKASDKPVTVKIRLGFTHDTVNAVSFAKTMESAGASLVAVHGRTTSDGYSGRADWDMIGKVAAALKIPVVGNGDICDDKAALYCLETYRVAGVMIGRGALGRPDLFSQLTGGEPCLLRDIIFRHLEYMRQYFGEKYIVTNIRKHLAYYLSGVPDTKKLKQELNKADSVSFIVSCLENLFNVREAF